MSARKYHTMEAKMEAERAAKKKYFLANKEWILAKEKIRQRNLSEKQRARLRELQRKRYHENPEKYRAVAREWYANNIEVGRNICRQWRRRNRAYMNNQTAVRRAKTKQHPDATHRGLVAVYREAQKATRETGITHNTDHIIPLNQDGPHHELNLQVLTFEQNNKKSDDAFWISPPEHKDWRDVPAWLWPKALRLPYLKRVGENRGKTLRWDTVLVPTVEARKPTEPATTPRFVLQHNY